MIAAAFIVQPALVRALAFRGGTALHKLFLPAPLRYSDDIDLVQVAPGPLGDLMRALRGRLDPVLGASEFERSPISLTAVYRFRCEIPPMQPLRLTVEINTASPSACWASTSVRSEWRALVHRERRRRDLYQRSQGRDLFDLATALERELVAPDAVVRCCLEYLKAGR